MKCRYEHCVDEGLPTIGLCHAHHAIAIAFDLAELAKAAFRDQSAIQRARLPVGSRHLKRAKASIGDRTFLYVMSRAGGYHKIGKSNNPNAREASLRSSLCDPSIELTFVCAVDDVLNRERAAHFLLRDHLISGEWFDVTESDAIATVLQVADGPLPADLGAWRIPKQRRNFIHMTAAEADALWRPKL